MLKDKDKKSLTRILNWWALSDLREASLQTFLTERKDDVSQYIEYGTENLTPRHMKVRVSSNMTEFSPTSPVRPETITVPKIIELLGEKQKVTVIDSSDPKRCFNLLAKKFGEYWSEEERLPTYSVHAWEFSKSQLGRYISRPQCVNKLDWIDLWWPTEEREAGVFPRVQKQVTLSPAGAFTHFHIDTGGASRWYNVMRGEQILLLVPPTDQSLQAYKDWILKRSTDEKQQVFFPDLVKVTIKCVVKEGETIFVPSGWAYAIYTARDTIAFGGSFLHGPNFKMQLRIHTDIDEKCPERAKIRFPYFEEMMWYVADAYVQILAKSKGKPTLVTYEEQGLAELAKWLRFYKANKPATVSSGQYVMDCLDAFVKGNALPSEKDYPPDEDPDSEDNNDQCVECMGKVESTLWIGCDGCGCWYHAPCIGLSKKELDTLTNSENDYHCYKCSGAPKPTPRLHHSSSNISNNSTEEKSEGNHSIEVEEGRPIARRTSTRSTNHSMTESAEIEHPAGIKRKASGNGGATEKRTSKRPRKSM